jgi:cytochrome c5
MSKRKLILFALLFVLPMIAFRQASAQQPAAADMAKKMEATCTGFCHGPSLIAQQRLDRNGWTREVDKMTRWGANVQPADKDALVAYLARTFNASRPMPSGTKSVPAGKGSDLFQTYCLACHNDSVVTSRKLSKVGWTAQVDQMIKWGAYVPTNRKDELIDYLLAHWGQ